MSFLSDERETNFKDDKDFIIIPTSALVEMHLGYDSEAMECIEAVGMSIEGLKTQIDSLTVGIDKGVPYRRTIDGYSETYICPCIVIGGEMYPLMEHEFEPNYISWGVPQDMQVKIFLRLLKQNKITIEDILNEDLHSDMKNYMYKLTVEGEEMRKQKLKILEREIKKYRKMVENGQVE